MGEPDTPSDDTPSDDLKAANTVLAEWAARSASESDALVARFEAMGYEVRGKSEDEIAEALRKPPARKPGA